MTAKYILTGPPVKGPLYLRSMGIKYFETLKELSKTDKLAFINVATKEAISYKALFEITTKVAIHLENLGLAGKIIAVCSEKTIDFCICILAAFYIGSPITLINHGYTQRELKHACDLVKPHYIFCSNDTYLKFKDLQMQEAVKYLQEIVIFRRELFNYIIGINEFQPRDVDPKEHIAVLLFSSGTTGLPKAVALTHKNLSFSHRQYLNSHHILEHVTNTIVCLPFYHVSGFNISFMLLLKGHTVKFLEQFNPKHFLSAIETYKVNFLLMVPPLLVFLAKYPMIEQYDLSTVTSISCGAATSSKQLILSVQERLKSKPEVYQAYGLTEACFCVISVPFNTKPIEGSIGKADSGVEVQIRDVQTKQSLGPNQNGEICVRGDFVMKEYYGNSVATRKTITDDGWLLTGDLGYYDKDENIFIVDRLKEVIKFKGFQVPPAELEGLLIVHPKVQDAAVVGLPDEAAGELPLAFIVKKPGVELKEQEIIEFIKKQVSYAKQLHGGIRFVESIPKSKAGKILRRDLLEILKAEASKSKL